MWRARLAFSSAPAHGKGAAPGRVIGKASIVSPALAKRFVREGRRGYPFLPRSRNAALTGVGCPRRKRFPNIKSTDRKGDESALGAEGRCCR